MIRLDVRARGQQPPVSAKLSPELRASLVGVHQNDGSRLPGRRTSENLRQRVVQLARRKADQNELKKDSDVRNTAVSFLKSKDATSAPDTHTKHDSERDTEFEVVVELKNSARRSPFLPRRARASGIKLREGGVVNLSPDGRGQPRPERLVLRELNTNTPSPARIPRPPALPRSENTDHAQSRSDVTVIAETTLLDIAAGINTFTASRPTGPRNTGNVHNRRLTIGRERVATGSSVPTLFVLNPHGTENVGYQQQRSYKPEQPWSANPASPSGQSRGVSYPQDAHQNNLGSPQTGVFLRTTNTSLIPRNSQEPSKRTLACLSPGSRVAPPNRSVRFQTDDSSLHDPLTDTSRDSSTRSPHPNADDQACGVRGSAIPSSVPHPSSGSPRCYDYHKRATPMELYRRRLRLKQKTFVEACQNDEDYIITPTAPAPGTSGQSCARDDPNLAVTIVRQPTPFGPRRTADKMDAALEKRGVQSRSSEDSETTPGEAVTTPAPQVSTYVLEEDLAKRLQDGDRTHPLALTLHNLNLHNALHQRRIERERLRLRRAQRQERAAGEARAETQDGAGDPWDGFPEVDVRLRRWLLETQRQSDFRPMVTFKIPVQAPLRV